MNRSFYSLWSSQSITSLASSLFMLTLIAAVYQMTGSAAYAGAVSFIRSIAVLASSFTMPFWYKKLSLANITRLLLTLQIVTSITVAFSLIPISHILSTNGYILYIFFMTVLISYTESCTVSATNALYPRLVSNDKRVHANSLVSTSLQIFSLFSWTFGGILVAKFGITWVLQLAVGLLCIGLICIIRLSRTHHQANELGSTGSLISGWKYLFGNPRLRVITWMDMIEGIAGGIWIGGITLVFVQEVLKQNEAWWGYINAAYYAGTIIGGIITYKFATWINRHLTVTIIMGSFGVSILVFSYAINVYAIVALVIVIIMGPFYQLRDIAQRTFVQQYTPVEEQPNVFAAQGTISYVWFGISILAAGIVSDLFGARSVYVSASILYLISSILGLILRRTYTN